MLSLLLLSLLAEVGVGLYKRPDHPIVLEQSGGFNIGGKVIHDPDDPDQTLTCDHGYTEYFIPWESRKTSLVMWHSSSSQVWQNRWDGGEGFKDKFLRRGYPVYIWDGPRVGRAGWSCEAFSYEPNYRDNGNFVAWNFGPEPGVWWDDAQFPTKDRAYHLQQAIGDRYIEFGRLTLEPRHLPYSMNSRTHTDTGFFPKTPWRASSSRRMRQQYRQTIT